jgi:hypothetical protein
MFNDANGEQIGVFAKIEPFVAEYRTRTGHAGYYKNLEQLVMKMPNAKELASTRSASAPSSPAQPHRPRE